jgi:glycosyltransferase involved in cell wall biosynthesis
MHISRASLMVCQFLIPLIEAQKKRGDYVCVCGSDDSDMQKLQDMGIDVFPHRLKRNLNPFNLAREILRIKRVLIEQKIDVVVCHSPIGAGVGRMAARLAKTPNIIYFAHGLPCAPGQSILIWLVWFCIEKVLGKITDAVLVMNNYDEQLCKTHRLVNDTNKVFRISGMGVDLKKFKPQTAEDKCHLIRRELGIPEGKKIVLCVAYLIPEKGVFVLLNAAGKICVERRDVCFLLVGSGPSTDELGKSIKATHLEDNFKLLGWRGDIDRLIQIADVFVLPTYYFEGLPVAILEAMACGKPVIATQHRGCEDAVVDGQTGFLIPVKQVAPLVDKLLLLLDDEQLRKQMGQAGRQQVEGHFELKYCTEKIVEALEKAIR